ncbi:type IIL restriction-modification enzyme MmeI [Azospirillum picis]|uniref:Type II restriction/modification system DNA methylase subunit YeeA n=1 Tax=Azospirillum picis TaxID=488438 RepID=A0ABU0MTJ0_9PROT|nr:type IIL restriction-modification enzyme MmeI [Azospirillum picis]MBP2302830.1 type II restriction/modification system DNA methylase subunit YeeA [Azospirillum picis]MDQ0536508.1 type II restriction/modification system DNA methylase subunit YeeA [Azospirillum picis]
MFFSSLLDGEPVSRINADLTAMAINLTMARRLRENYGAAFQGPVKVGPFDIPGQLAREWLKSPVNPNGKGNLKVVFPWANGMDLVRRSSDTWIVNFSNMEEEQACLYEKPYHYVKETVKPIRDVNRDRQRRENWWKLGRSGAELQAALKPFSRYIATPRVSKHRIFVWLDRATVPDSALVAIARDDATTYGILHSRFHEAWTLGLCTWLGVGNDPRYTPSTTFETFPFPEGLTPDIPAADYAENPHAKAIAQAAERLDILRRNWLNPPDLVMTVPEVVPGFPDRILPKDAAAAAILKKRTLTNLYNERPAWLVNAHRQLDEAVAAAYGWPADLTDDEVLARLLDLNLARAGAEGAPELVEVELEMV